MNNYNLEDIFQHEKKLYDYALDGLSTMNDVFIYGNAKNKGGILTFNIKNIHPNDIAMIFDQQNVAIRTGHHCAQPLMKKLGVNSTARASFGIYNDEKDVDIFLESIDKVKKFFKT